MTGDFIEFTVQSKWLKIKTEIFLFLNITKEMVTKECIFQKWCYFDVFSLKMFL